VIVGYQNSKRHCVTSTGWTKRNCWQLPRERTDALSE
jgi:hypothetical protein